MPDTDIWAQAQEILLAWITANVGTVAHVERQGRWRPAWFVDVVRGGGETLKLYVRGGRDDANLQPTSLSFEAEAFRIFEAGGVLVPHVYGYIEEIPAIIMDHLPGRPDLHNAATDADRDTIRMQLVDQMILTHRSSTQLFEAAGLPRPAGGKNLALAYYRRIGPLYEAYKSRPEPIIEFVRGWIERNIPDHPDIAYPITVDAGQFIFEGDQLTAMLDFEYTALGNYHTDLAALRFRSRMEYIGDLGTFYRAYAERSGLPVSADLIRYHTVVKGVLPPMQMVKNFAATEPRVDYLQYLIWNAGCLRLAIEAMAEILGLEAETFQIPLAAPPGRFDIIAEAMTAEMSDLPGDDGFADYRRGKHVRNLRFFGRRDRFQAELNRRYVTEVAALTGQSPSGWAEADRILEAYVRQAGPAQDETLLRLFWRHLQGQGFLLADAADPGSADILSKPLARLEI